MKKILPILFAVIIGSSGLPCYSQTDNQKNNVTDFVSKYGALIFNIPAHPTCTVQTFYVNFYNENNFDIVLNYIDAFNSKFTCTYNLSMVASFITDFTVKSCGSPDFGCFKALNLSKDLARRLYYALNKNQNNNDGQADQIMQRIENHFKKKLEDLSIENYCFGFLIIYWSDKGYRNNYFNNLPAPASAGNSATLTKIMANQRCSLTGTLKMELFYGAPGYGDNPSTDEKEYSYILYLETPILFKDPDFGSNDWATIDKIHVFNSSGSSFTLADFNNKRVTIDCTLAAANTVHHHAPAITWALFNVR